MTAHSMQYSATSSTAATAALCFPESLEFDTDLQSIVGNLEPTLPSRLPLVDLFGVPSFNTLRRAVVDEIFVEFVVVDGRVVTLTCNSVAEAQSLAEIKINGIEVEFE